MLKSHFRPEFLNRLDEIVMFKPLSQTVVEKIIDLTIQDVNKRLVEKELTVSLSKEAKEYITAQGYDISYGARPLKRFVQKHVETLAARLILADGVHSGDTICIEEEMGELVAKAKA